MNKMTLKKAIGFCFILISLPLGAQTVITLDQCVSYALANNLSIQKQALSIEKSQIKYDQSKNEAFPNLSFGGSYNYMAGRAQSPNTSDDMSINSGDVSLGLSSDFVVFNGFQNKHLIKQNKYNFLGSQAALDQQKLELKISVTLQYLQVLFFKEALNNSNIQIQLIQMHKEQVKKMAEIGVKNKLELLDFATQETLELQKKVEIESQLRVAVLSLSQLVNIDSLVNCNFIIPEGFDSDSVNIPNAGFVYEHTADRLPSIVCATNMIMGAEEAMQVARAHNYPALTLRSTFYSRFNQNPFNALQYDPGNPSMSYPIMQTGNSQFFIINLGLTYSIFNRKQVQSNIREARVGIQESKLNLETTRQSLKKEIEQMCLEASNAMEKYKAARTSLTALEEMFNYIKTKQLNGSASTIEFNEAALKLENARIDVLKARFELILKSKILEYFLKIN